VELLLNLAWLLLALPACWLWRNSKGVQFRRRVSSIQCLMALACLLVILFPVVSATDDLHAMRTEMEESPIGKRSFCHKSGDRPSAWKGYIQPSFASSLNSLQSGEGIWHQIPTSQSQIVAAPPSSRVSRGPPQSHIG
jgi:hypothetical protein